MMMMMMLLTAKKKFDHRGHKGSDATCMSMCSWRIEKDCSG